LGRSAGRQDLPASCQASDIGETIDIPNVAFDEEARGKGAFTRYLSAIELEAQRVGLDGVYVENIFNPRPA
jgi:N-acetylglutamate synthase-like GNAT family acetyltransferase